MAPRTLIFIPTYNERENAARICEQIHALSVDADVLFVDDDSPDGTGDLLESLKPTFPRLLVHHRARKLGIGSAHLEGIEWAYDQNYQQLVTLDCDFSHTPSDIPKMIATAQGCDVSVGSRWVRSDSLSDWNLYRRCMTRMGRLLTKGVLGIPQDASGAFRVYRLDRVPRELFQLVKSRGYPFFFESLFILNRNGFSIKEVPICLPARTYGHSKMSATAACRSARYVFELWLANLRKPEQFLLERRLPEIDLSLIDPQQWDNYWNDKSDTGGTVYEFIAGIYCRCIIKRRLERAIECNFAQDSSLLHAGCGSGQVDVDLHPRLRITALDISPAALHRYARNNPAANEVRHGSIFALPFPDASFDGVYNLGVLEHFDRADIVTILREFGRVLKPGGRILLFWPHARATSVFVLRAWHLVRRLGAAENPPLHPPELSLLQSRVWASEILSNAGLNLTHYDFGIRDLFVQAVVVTEVSLPAKGETL